MKSANKNFAELVESVWLLVLHRGAESWSIFVVVDVSWGMSIKEMLETCETTSDILESTDQIQNSEERKKNSIWV